MSDVFLRIWRVTAKIPRGRVATYGQIARIAGLHGGARTVGWAMRAVPGGLRVAGRPIPWHRVINAQGRIARRGGAADEMARQALLLRREGIALSPRGSIDLRRYLWSGTGRSPRS